MAERLLVERLRVGIALTDERHLVDIGQDPQSPVLRAEYLLVEHFPVDTGLKVERCLADIDQEQRSPGRTAARLPAESGQELQNQSRMAERPVDIVLRIAFLLTDTGLAAVQMVDRFLANNVL